MLNELAQWSIILVLLFVVVAWVEAQWRLAKLRALKAWRGLSALYSIIRRILPWQ